MKKLYHIFDPQTLHIIGAGFYKIKPENSTEAKNENYIKPMYNTDNDTIYDGATQEEIAEIEKAKVPKEVKNMKFRLAMIKSGISINVISQAIEQMEQSLQKEQIQTLWDFVDYFERDDKTLVAMAVKFGITTEQLDNLFILSDTL